MVVLYGRSGVDGHRGAIGEVELAANPLTVDVASPTANLVEGEVNKAMQPSTEPVTPHRRTAVEGPVTAVMCNSGGRSGRIRSDKHFVMGCPPRDRFLDRKRHL